jgi:hypothetical protein
MTDALSAFLNKDVYVVPRTLELHNFPQFPAKF